MSDCRKAAEWVQAKRDLFAMKVELPHALRMAEEELAEALQLFRDVRLEETMVADEQERESVLEPFKFVFQSKEDMWKFMEEIVVRRGYLVYCEFV